MVKDEPIERVYLIPEERTHWQGDRTKKRSNDSRRKNLQAAPHSRMEEGKRPGNRNASDETGVRANKPETKFAVVHPGKHERSVPPCTGSDKKKHLANSRLQPPQNEQQSDREENPRQENYDVLKKRKEILQKPKAPRHKAIVQKGGYGEDPQCVKP